MKLEIKKIKVNAIVVTYNRKNLLEECLDAILDQTYPVNKIILIDNNSTDGTENFLKKRGYLANKRIDYYKLNKNIGGAGGFYTGLKISIKDNNWSWIMDDDVIPAKNSLEELISARNFLYHSKENISFLASSVFGTNNEVMNVPLINTKKERNGYASWYKYLDKGLVSISTATFVSLLINPVAIKKVGLPCKDYFIWGDDTEYTRRLTKYFANAYFSGNSKVIHKRKNAQSLNIFNVTEKKRLSMYWYYYRNNLINTFYYDGYKSGIKLLFLNIKTIIKCIGKKNGAYIAGQIIKGSLMGIFMYHKIEHYIEGQKKNE